MSNALTIHLAFGVLVVIVVLIFGWSQFGLRIVACAVGLEIALGIVVVALIVHAGVPLPRMVWLHIISALAAGVAYLVARRLGTGAGAVPLRLR